MTEVSTTGVRQQLGKGVLASNTKRAAKTASKPAQPSVPRWAGEIERSFDAEIAKAVVQWCDS